MLYGVVNCGIMYSEVFPMKLNYDRKSKDPTYFIQVGIRNGKKGHNQKCRQDRKTF